MDEFKQQTIRETDRILREASYHLSRCSASTHAKWEDWGVRAVWGGWRWEGGLQLPDAASLSSLDALWLGQYATLPLQVDDSRAVLTNDKTKAAN